MLLMLKSVRNLSYLTTVTGFFLMSLDASKRGMNAVEEEAVEDDFDDDFDDDTEEDDEEDEDEDADEDEDEEENDENDDG